MVSDVYTVNNHKFSNSLTHEFTPLPNTLFFKKQGSVKPIHAESYFMLLNQSHFPQTENEAGKMQHPTALFRKVR